MGCKTSKEAHAGVAELKLDSSRRRSRAKPGLALAVNDDSSRFACPEKRLSVIPLKTPAVTPQAEACQGHESRRTSKSMEYAIQVVETLKEGVETARNSDAEEQQRQEQQQQHEQRSGIPSLSGRVQLSRVEPPTTPKVSPERDVTPGEDGAVERENEQTEQENEETRESRKADGDTGYPEDTNAIIIDRPDGKGDPKAQDHHQHKQLPVEEAVEEPTEIADWPTSPVVHPSLHKFLEIHRPRANTQDLPGGRAGTPGDCGSSDRSCRRIRFPGGLAYEGQLRQELGRETTVPEGWGRITFRDSTFYEGSWRCGVIHGKGALHLSNGNCYFGSWAYGRKHGLGTYIYADGSRHEGLYVAGERSGVGKMHYASGAMYEGHFKAGLRHGVGRLELASVGGGGRREGASYDGEWVCGLPHGHGVYVDPADGGERFEGSWRDGVRSGVGTMVQGWSMTEGGDEQVSGEGEESGEEGEQKEGQGSSEIALYSGNFEGGYPHGDGMMQYGSASFCGHFEHGLWNGGGRIDLGEHGMGSFVGTWLDGIPRGGGRWQYRQSGIEVDCTFTEGYSQ